MNDRFKFRCWNKLQNKMFYVINISWFYEKIKRIEAFEPETKKIFIFDEYDQNIENTILMQSTGLKDKNGKLIYEGDILGGIYHGYIGYCNECKCFQLKVKDYGCLACEGDIHWYELVEAEEQNELEVLGNIYENPELLKE